MGVSEYSNGEAVTMGRLNETIRATNRLEDANNLQAHVRLTNTIYSSYDDKIEVQGMRIEIYDTSPDSWLINDIHFPKAFTRVPVVTATLYGSSARGIVCHVEEITGSTCTIRVSKLEPSTAFPRTMAVSIIAIGPVA